MSRPHLSSTTLSSAEVPLIHLNKGSSRSETSLPSTGTWPGTASGISKQGQTYRRNRSNATLEILTDVLSALLSVVFLVYGIFVARHDGKPVAENRQMTNVLINATKIGPTIFPILFAAVLGRALKAIMLWRLERGERLGLLDLLAGSTTVVNTLLTQISLRILNTAGLLLILAWAISPIGGQASLRVMSVAQQNYTSIAPVKYMSANHSFNPYVSGDLGSLATLTDGLYNAALLGPEKMKSSPTDTWSNVKVPIVETSTDDTALLANNSWIAVPSQGAMYSALIGHPIGGLPPSANATFNIETFYWTLDCGDIQTSFQPLGDPSRPGLYNATNDLGNTLIYSYAPMPNNKTYCRGDPYDPDYTPRVLSYNSYDLSNSQFSSVCTIKTSYVEVEVGCTINSNCSATRIRNSTLKHPSPTWTMLDGPADACNWFDWFFNQWIDTVSVKRSGTATPAQGYLLDPTSPASPSLDQPMTTIDKKTFGIRLAQLLNSFWLITAGPYAVPYGLTGDIGASTPNEYDQSLAANVTTTEAQVTQTFDVIRCHIGWLVTLLASSLFLIASSLLSIGLRLKSKTPDLSLNWSTLTRDNPYVETSFAGSSMDHTKRARAMKGRKVRFGDVETEGEIGHLAVGSVDESRVVGKVGRGREFD